MMKSGRALLLLFLLLKFTGVHAQFMEGRMGIGGEGSLYVLRNKFRSETRLEIRASPSYQYLYNDNRMFGAGPIVNWTGSQYNGSRISAFSIGAHVFLKQYKPIGTYPFGFLLQEKLAGTTPYGILSGGSFSNLFLTAVLSPGMYIFLNQHTALELMIDPAYISYNSLQDEMRLVVSLQAVNFRLGLTYLFFNSGANHAGQK